MQEPVDLLLITHNRRPYVEKTLPQILADPAEFRLHCWDNASTDGTGDVIASLDDPRVFRKHFSKTNVNQEEPCLRFLETAPGAVVGKVDDDILNPHGWIDRIAPMIAAEPRFGMLACWGFMSEDWRESLARRNFVRLGPYTVCRTVAVAGRSFLARRECLRRYVKRKQHGIPLDRLRMTQDGLVSGYPIPILMAHNMDDPRSPHCLMNQEGTTGEQASLTARNLGFQSVAEYTRWIAADAYARQRYSWRRHLWWRTLAQDQSAWGRAQRFLLRWLRPA